MRFLQLRYWSPLNIVRFCKRTTTTKDGFEIMLLSVIHTHVFVCVVFLLFRLVHSFHFPFEWIHDAHDWLIQRASSDGNGRRKLIAKHAKDERQSCSVYTLHVVLTGPNANVCDAKMRAKRKQKAHNNYYLLLRLTTTKWNSIQKSTEWQCTRNNQLLTKRLSFYFIIGTHTRSVV